MAILVIMEEKKKAKILLEDVGDGVRLVLEGNHAECSYMIAHYYVSCPEFRRMVNFAIKQVMKMGVEHLERERLKDMDDEH